MVNEMRQQLIAGKGLWVPLGVTEEMGTRWTPYEAFAEALKESGSDVSRISALSASEIGSPRLAIDFKRGRVLIEV